MVLKLYGHPISTCTSRVRTVLAELNVPYEYIAVDFTKDEHKTPAFLAVQPFGQVPYLDDDGFTVYESRAICRYLALTYGGVGTLVPDPADVRRTALFEQAASVETSNFDAYASALAFELYMPTPGAHEAVVERLKATLDSKLAGYDAILGKTKYLAGDEITLADLFHLPYGTYLRLKNGIDLFETGKYPNVARWWKDLSGRASWKEVVPAW